jgi:hypothetical protein
MGLSLPLLQSGSRSGEVESPSELSPLLPAQEPLFQSILAIMAGTPSQRFSRAGNAFRNARGGVRQYKTAV